MQIDGATYEYGLIQMNENPDDSDDGLEASKRRHPAYRSNEPAKSGERLTIVSGVDPEVTPGVWRRSQVDGYAWFEAALFDTEGLDIEDGEGI